jgi:hypothetical protein
VFSAFNWLNENLNPAYSALTGYVDEAQASENGCGFWTEAKYGAQGVLGLVGTAGAATGITATIESAGYFTGREITVNPTLRISPFGNGTADDLEAQLPHYHRLITDANGDTVPDGSMKWHRPWQKGF